MDSEDKEPSLEYCRGAEDCLDVARHPLARPEFHVVAARKAELPGAPVLTVDGYATWTGRYDPSGQLIEQSFFGVDGKPARHSKWWTRPAPPAARRSPIPHR